MKKIMIFTIILMPLIILALLFLSGNIVNRSTYLYVEYIEFVDDEIILNKTSSEDVSATAKVNVFPLLANNKEVEFWSANEDIVTIDEKGNLMSGNFGTTYIYAKSKENGAKQATCKVVVTSEKVHKIWIENPISTIYVRDTHRIETKYLPLEAKEVDFEYSSSNAEVLYVSPDGELLAKSNGRATITVSLQSDKNIQTTFDVIVKDKVEDIWIEDSSPIISGKTSFEFPKINFVPSTASEEITYFSSDETIATVDNDGKINFLQAGTVVITAKVEGVDKILEKSFTSTYGYISDIQFLNPGKQILNFEDWTDVNPQFLWSYSPSDANIQNISISSSNINVIKFEDNQFKVVGGGTAIITLSAKTSNNGTIERNLTVEINRKIETIKFEQLDFSYIYDKTTELNVIFAPLDATENILLKVSDESIAEIQNGKLIFTTDVIKNKYGKVDVTAYTASGVSKTITIVYLDKNITQIALTDQETLDFTMPKTGEEQYLFAIIFDNKNLTNIELKIENGTDILSQNGYIFALKNNGEAEIGVYFSNSKTADKIVKINVKRLAESINNVKITAKWENSQTKIFNSDEIIYSSSKIFEINYEVFPGNVTSSVKMEIIGDSAEIIDEIVQFKKAGKIKVILSVDEIVQEFYIESTYGYPDEKIEIIESFEINKDEKISLWDKINISPELADKNNISFIAENEKILIDEAGNVVGKHGGQVKIFVTITTSLNKINKIINVKVNENAENIEIVGDKFVYITEKTFDLKDKFKILPETANVKNDLTYGVEENDIVTINKQNQLVFEKAGRCTVYAKLENNAIAKITVVYVGEELVLDAETTNYMVYKGTKFILKPSSEILANANYDAEFISENLDLISDEIFITITNDASISFNGVIYNFDCVESIENISLIPKNLEDVDEKATSSFITGLIELELKGKILGVAENYLQLNYSVDKSEIASIDDAGLIKFFKAGEIAVTFEAKFKDVFGAENIIEKTSIKIESTFGEISEIKAKNFGIIEFIIDDFDTTKNSLNINSLIEVFPTQILISESNIKLISQNTSIAEINGLEINFKKGGNVKIEVQIKSKDQFKSAIILEFAVKKNAETIYVNGEEIVDGKIYECHKSTLYIMHEAYPQDANINCDISWQVIENNDVADIDYSSGRIIFKMTNEFIAIKFTLGTNENIKEFVVYYKTTIITFEVDIESEIIVVPINEPFTFVSTEGNILDFSIEFSENLNVTQIADDVFSVNESDVGNVLLKYNGISRYAKLIATTNMQKINDVKIADVDMYGENKKIDAEENKLTHITASKYLQILYNIPKGYDKFGNLINYTILQNDTQIESNLLNFTAKGTYKISILINFEDAYGSRQLEYSFEVYTTFGEVDEFGVSDESYNFVFDTMLENEKIIDIFSDLKRISPQYGEVFAPSVEIIDDSVVNFVDDKLQICGSGQTDVIIHWGNRTKTIKITVDKYIDGFNFIDNGEIVSQIVVNSNTYALNYELIIENSNFMPTLNEIEISAIGDCVINQNIIIFNKSNAKFEITIKAKNGTASAKLIVIRVDKDVNIITANSLLNNIVIEKNKTNIFDFRFGTEIVNLMEINLNEITILDENLGTFKGNFGSEGKFTFDNGQEINFIVTENVEEIKFKEDAFADGIITAMGDKNDGNGIDLSMAYGAYFYPLTSRNSEKPYNLEILVNNPEIAYIEDGILYFINQGEIVLTFKAGGVEIQKSIESTLGYVKEVEFLNADKLIFEFNNENYLLPTDFYRIFPADAYKFDAIYKSTDLDVFTIDERTINFVGGGEAKLELRVKTSESESISIFKNVYIINRALDVVFYEKGVQVGYLVKNYSNSGTIILHYEIISEGKLSPYIVEFASSDPTVATIANGIITFVGNGTVYISVKVRDSLNLEDEFDIVSALKICNNEEYNINYIKNNDVEDIVLEINSKNNILCSLPGKNITDFEYEIQSGSDVIEITDNGEIIPLKGGEATILISEKQEISYLSNSGENIWSKLVTIFIYKKAEINLSETNVYTSKTEWDIDVSFGPEDALIRKTIEYISSDTNIATVLDGKISFKQAGCVEITINILYNDEIEISKKFVIESTFGQVAEFEIDSYDCVLNNGETKIFTIKNILPLDFSGTLNIFSENSVSYSITILDSTSFKVKGLKRGLGTIAVKYNGSENFTQNINVEIKQLSNSIDFQQNGVTITELRTFSNEVILTAVVKPFDANDTTVSWEVLSGDATVVDGKIVFASYGSATILAKSNDGASSNSIVIEYVQDIEDFTISYNGESVENDSTIYLEWNVSKMVLSINILPTTLTNFKDFECFIIECTNGSTATIDSYGKIIIDTISHLTSPAFEDVITIKYKNKFEKSIKILRDGIQKVDFGNHDNELDSTYGLQQMRLFGNRSYYDGIQNYYRMTVNVYPSNNLLSNIVWETSNSNVTIDNGDGYVDIYFNKITGSSLQEIYDDIFTNGEIIVTAKNKAGENLYSYTFHIVNAVNVFDQDGYVNGGAEIVLQKSLGHDDQATQISENKYARLDAYSAKTTIYGNGNLINFAHRNKDTSESSYANYENIQVSIKNAINLTIQGSNYDATRDSYNIELSGTQKLSYCELYYMYRSVEITSGEIHVKRCLFRTFKSSGIIGSAEGTKKLFFEDIIMFDVGTRAIELQKNATAYIKGFLDVYNFQNKEAIKEYTSLGASTIIRRFNAGDMVVEIDGESWVNMVGISSKGTDLKMYYYIGEAAEGETSTDSTIEIHGTSKYQYCTDGNHTAASGLTRITYGVGNLGITAWSYTNGSQPHLVYDNEYKADGSLNVEYMISTTPKIKRLSE